jgi:hypothetical protein
MTNVTLSIDEKVLRQARILALQEGTSLNAVIREFLKDYIGDKKHYQQVTRRILQQAEQSQYNSGGLKWTREALHER